LAKTLGLVSCAKSKRSYPCTAKEMYQPSDLFRKAYGYAVKRYDLVAILSAKYGLLLPDEVIEPYDLTLNMMSDEA
jgi:methionyl-tRNA formyltransferase